MSTLPHELELKKRRDEVATWYMSVKRQETTVGNSTSGTRSHADALREFKVMKAATFLILYSLVEAVVRLAVDAIWDEIKAPGIHASKVRSELRSLWLDARYRQIDLYSASARTFRDEAGRITEDVVLEKAMAASFRELAGGGNLDQIKIAELCKRHRLNFSPSPTVRAGADLSTIRQRRNELAHGLLTFDEIGSLYTISDLEEIRVRTLRYLKSFSMRVSGYISAREFLI